MVPVSRIAVMDFVPRPKECRDPYSVAMGREADALLTVSIRRFLTRCGHRVCIAAIETKARGSLSQPGLGWKRVETADRCEPQISKARLIAIGSDFVLLAMLR
jgi:hypothetical protein